MSNTNKSGTKAPHGAGGTIYFGSGGSINFGNGESIHFGNGGSINFGGEGEAKNGPVEEVILIEPPMRTKSTPKGPGIRN